MNAMKLDSALYSFASRFTEWFPSLGSKVIDRSAYFTLGNPLLIKILNDRNSRLLKNALPLKKICCVADMHIGDAILSQAAIVALRDFFPEARIDYVVNRYAIGLIDGNPDITNIYPIYSGNPLPVKDEIGSLNQIFKKTNYDVIFNFGQFFSKKNISGFKDHIVIDYSGLVAKMTHDDSHPEAVNHISYQTHQFIQTLLVQFQKPIRINKFQGINIYLSREAMKKSFEFTKTNCVPADRKIIFFNPDAASRFTRIPSLMQNELLTELAKFNVTIMIGASRSQEGSEQILADSLPPEKKSNIIIVPKALSIDAYAALIDRSDVYISADTGPLHLAAARKFCKEPGFSFRNRTAVLSIFGATPARMFGYDSRHEGFLPANQDAPSRTYIAESSCRNISCANKLFKNCKNILCFRNVDIAKIVKDVKSVLWQTS